MRRTNHMITASVLFENIPNGYPSRRKSISTGILLQRPEQARYCENFTALHFTLNAYTHFHATNIHIWLVYTASFWNTRFPCSPIIVNWCSIMTPGCTIIVTWTFCNTIAHLYKISYFDYTNEQCWMC